MVKIVYEEEKNRAAAYDGDQCIGESTYLKSGNLWTIDHTEVSDQYKGQRIAGRLVAELVHQAREKNIKIMPLCSFAKREFENKKEYHDVLAHAPKEDKDGRQ